MITLRTDPHAFVSELAFIHIHLDALPAWVQERACSTHCILHVFAPSALTNDSIHHREFLMLFCFTN
jgi:hypothetical protein